MKKISLILLFSIKFVSAQTIGVDTLNYDAVYQFQDGFALTLKNNKYGIINSNLQVIIPPILEDMLGYDLSPYFFYNELFGVINDTSVIFDTLGNVTKRFNKRIGIEEANPSRLLSKSRKVGSFTIRTGSNIYSEFGSSDWGCVSENGDTIIPFEYFGIVAGTLESFIGIEKNNKTYYSQIYSKNGEKKMGYQGRLFGWPNRNCLWKETERGFVATDSNLDLLDSNYYDWVYVFENICWVNTQAGWQALDLEFNVIDSMKCDYFWQNEHWCFALKDDYVAIFNQEGIRITEYIYDGTWSDYVSNSKYILAKVDEYYYVLNSEALELKKFILRKTIANNK